MEATNMVTTIVENAGTLITEGIGVFSELMAEPVFLLVFSIGVVGSIFGIVKKAKGAAR